MSLFPNEDILTKEIESWKGFGASLMSFDYYSFHRNYCEWLYYSQEKKSYKIKVQCPYIQHNDLKPQYPLFLHP
jgi:hypothetical protein